LISTVRVSVAPLPAIGLADHTMLPEVAEPVALPVDVLLGAPLLPQPAKASAPAAMPASSKPPLRRRPRYLADVRLDMCPP
jgi:hypothetical protein